MEQYGFKPKEMLVMGDNYDSDILPATKLGINAHHIANIDELKAIISTYI